MSSNLPNETNLLNETIKDIKNSGHTPEDIIFIGSENSGYSCSWNEFKKLANEEYDDGFGASKVAIDLIIVFTDGAKMWRGEYDGSEWWNYSKPFKKPKILKPIKHLFIFGGKIGWETVKQLNEEEE